jgi:hypothetical protein
MEETMSTTISRTLATRRSETHHMIGATAIAFCTRFVAAARRRREERRMLLTVQQLDHPGVLADVEAVRRIQRG